MLLVNSFDVGQASGTTITTGNSGGNSQNAFDTVTNAPTYDNTHAHIGGNALKASVSSQSLSGAAWTNTGAMGGTQTTLYMRAYFYITSNTPPAYLKLFNLSSGTARVTVGMTTVGKLTIRRISNAGDYVACTGTAPTNAWFRVEAQVTASATTTGNCEIRTYTGSNPDSQTATENLTASSIATDCANFDQIIYGCQFSAPNTFGPIWVDDVGVSNVGFFGPSFNPGTPIVVNTAVTRAANY